MCLDCQGILFTYFESYVWPAQGPCCSGPMQASYVIILDTPRGDLSGLLSSSYCLSLFSSKASSHRGKNVGAVEDRSSSVSIGELWSEIDELDEEKPRATSMALAQNHRRDKAPRSHSSCHEMGQTGADSLPKAL
jgi:hypothetical protein